MAIGDGITYLAETRVKGEPKRFGIKDADRTHHIALLGRDENARATFLAGMALQDIVRGAGVLILDSEGILTQLILERFPKDAVERLIVLDPSDGEYPYSWNPIDDFRALPPEAALPTLSQTISSVYQCEDGQLSGFAASFLLGHPGMTILFLYDVIADPKARDRLLPKGSAERSTFDAILAVSADAAASIKEYGQYLAKDTLMRNILGQGGSKFTLETLSEGGIIIADLSRIRMFPTRVTPLSRLILAAGRTRAASPVAVYMSGCLRYLSTHELERSLLDRAIALTVSDMSHGEPGTLREKILQRAGTVATFAPHEDDVHLSGKAFYPYIAAEELEKLSAGQCVIALTIDSVRSRPFLANILPLPERSGVSVQDLQLASRGKYTITRLAADKLFKLPEEAKKPTAPDDSFSGAFRSIFTKRADPTGGASGGSAIPKPLEPKPAAPGSAQRPAVAEPVPPKSVTGVAEAKPKEIPEAELKKMVRVRKPKQ